MRRLTLAFITCLLAAAPAAAAVSIDLEVDATDAPRRLLHARLTMPAGPGPLTLLYPRWIPGEHGPNGPVTDVADLQIAAAGAPLPWRRVPTDMNSFEVTVPSGAREVQVTFDLLTSPPGGDRFTSGPSATPRVAVINWNQVVMYPAGFAMAEIRIQPSLIVPREWGAGTALKTASNGAGRYAFQPVSLETLVDSPVVIGRYHRTIPLGTGGGREHFIEAVADSEEALEAPDALRSAWERLVSETVSLFGATHYDAYRFLITLSDNVAHFGLEHHESSDNRVPERTWLEEDRRRSHATLLPHEFVHSWNGKHRRPADMVGTDFQKPVRTDLLWVYEGLTQYFGQVLTARSGLWTQEEYRDKLALMARWATAQSGRSWRSLADTAASAQLLFRSRRDWRALRRGTDFYDEGALIWLDADTLIREESKGRRSLEDFARRFHGGGSGPAVLKTYRREDLVRVLDEVHPHDWEAFFRRRVDEVAADPPLEGIERSGWRLVYADTPSALQKSYDKEDEQVDASASIGLVVKKDGTIDDVVPGLAADKAGVAPRSTLVAVNGRRFDRDVLHAGIAATKRGARLELLVESGGFFATHALDYGGGERYPKLERIPGRPDLLSQITAPKTTAGQGD